MRKLLKVTAAFLLIAAAAIGYSVPAFANAQVLCQPQPSGGVRGPARVTNPNTLTTYSLGANGCALIAVADIGYFQSQGWTQGGEMGSYVLQSQVTANQQVWTLPANTYIREIIVQETNGNAITGGLGVGTTSGATDIVTALTVGASAIAFVADSALKKRVFYAATGVSQAQAIWVSAVTSWNVASIWITIVYGYF